MSNSKNYNSIVFLTTLSVYLGLVLVGGTPSILAQAALAQKIEIQNEVEIKDDLDNKPDDKDCWDTASQDILDLLNSDFLSDGILDFISDIQNLIKIGKYEKGERFNFQFDYKATEGGIGQTDYQTFSGNRWLQLAASERVENLASNSFYRYDEELKANASHSKIQFTLENNDLIIKISKEKKSNKIAEDTVSFYNKTFEIGICSKYVDEPKKIIYQNSKASFENNQVFTVTRLPRGSLDALLARKDAQ